MPRNPAYKLEVLQKYTGILREHQKIWHTEDIHYVRSQLVSLMLHIEHSTITTIIAAIKALKKDL
jgi:hypothetical protein